MSLKFLAVGQSLAGIRGGKSPYELRKENQLPTFGGGSRFSGRQSASTEKQMVQTDFLEERNPAEGSTSTFQPAVPNAPSPFHAAPASSVPTPKRRWFSWFRWKWFRAQPSREDLIQSELSLDKVRVMRNDLADSDLQLVFKKKKKAKPVFSASQENNGLARQGWSELTAKLFEIGQK